MKYIVTSFLVLWILASCTQRITVDLPYFADQEYLWFANVGEKVDTLARGRLDAKGQTALSVPAAYKGWRGMSNFLLVQGGGFAMLLSGEGDFTVSCAVAMPTLDDIRFTGSDENTFLLQRYIEQQDLLSKIRDIGALAGEYRNDDENPFYAALMEEKTRFATLQQSTAESPLYAARIRQIADYCNGIGSRFNLTEEEYYEEQRAYVRDVLAFGQLWNSGYWKSLFARWMSMEAVLGDSVLLVDAKQVVARMNDYDVREKVIKKMTALFYQYAKEELLLQLGIDDLLAKGHKAPKLYQPDNTTIVPVNSLVVFYESECGNCENELQRLCGNYSILQGQNIRVITVSADTDAASYERNAAAFPWQQKLCDFKGFDGVNFQNYGIIGTPTMYLIDGKGVITGRFARWEELSHFLKILE